jgi:hypothetical protein
MRPNAEKHNADPVYIGSLLSQLRQLGRATKEVCRHIGVPRRTMSDYTNPLCPTEVPYPVQFTLECELDWEIAKHPLNKKLANGGIHPHNG